MFLNVWPLEQDFLLHIGGGATASPELRENSDKGKPKFSILYPRIHISCKVAWAILSEIVKIVVAKIFLEHLIRYSFRGKGERFLFEVYSRGVDGPIIEEVVYRLGLLQGIHLVQRFFLGSSFPQIDDRIDREEEGEGLNDRELVDERVSRIFRVHLSAIIFAAHHLLISRSYSHIGMAVNLTNSYMGGVIYGSLTEEYVSLAPAILVHGISNIAANFMSPTQITIGCYLALRIVSCLLAINRLNKL